MDVGRAAHLAPSSDRFDNDGMRLRQLSCSLSPRAQRAAAFALSGALATSCAPADRFASGADGGAGGAGGSAGGGGSAGAGGSAGSAGAGGGGGAACVDSCATRVGLDLCDGFDLAPTWLGWWEQQVSSGTLASVALTSDLAYSCSHAARIDFPGGEQPGWAQLSYRAAGSPTSSYFAAQFFREQAPATAHGIAEVYWTHPAGVCSLQLRLAESPPTLEVNTVSVTNTASTSFGSRALPLEVPSTMNAWLGLRIEIGQEPVPQVKVAVSNTEAVVPFDLALTQGCEGPPDAGSVLFSVGVPYETAPARLVFDDVRISAE